MPNTFSEENKQLAYEIDKRCKNGHFYMAKFLGGNGDKVVDEFPRPYRYIGDRGSYGVFREARIENGELRCRWYQVPMLFEVGKEISEETVIKMLKEENKLLEEAFKPVKEAEKLANKTYETNSEKLWETVK